MRVTPGLDEIRVFQEVASIDFVLLNAVQIGGCKQRFCKAP